MKLTQLLNYELWRPSRRPQSSYILPLLVYQFETLQCSHWNFSISVRHREFPVSVMSFAINTWWHFFVWHYNKQQEDFSNAAARCIINLILDSDWSKIFRRCLQVNAWITAPNAAALRRCTLRHWWTISANSRCGARLYSLSAIGKNEKMTTADVKIVDCFVFCIKYDR